MSRVEESIYEIITKGSNTGSWLDALNQDVRKTLRSTMDSLYGKANKMRRDCGKRHKPSAGSSFQGALYRALVVSELNASRPYRLLPTAGSCGHSFRRHRRPTPDPTTRPTTDHQSRQQQCRGKEYSRKGQVMSLLQLAVRHGHCQ